MIKQNGVLTDVTIEDLEVLKNDPNKFWEGVESIGFLAFSKNVKNELEEIEIPDTVLSIQNHAFYECMSLKKVKLPANLKVINKSLFHGCVSLEQIDIPDSVETISEFAFYSNALKKINLSHNSKLKHIKMCAFADNNDLEELYLPYNILSIEKDAFANCIELNRLEFSNRVPNIEIGAFEHKPITINIQNRNRKLSPNTISIMFENGSLKEKFKEENFYQVESALNNTLNTINTNSLVKYINFCYMLGAFEPSSTIINLNNSNLKACNMAYYFLKDVKEKGRFNYRYLPFDEKFENTFEYDENFLKFVINSENWSDLEKDENFFIKLTSRYDEKVKEENQNKSKEIIENEDNLII